MGFLRELFRRPPQHVLELSRNEQCWCGSGKKYKHCHYDSDQKYFARKHTSECKQRT